jgi:hypothetical protein
MTRPWRVDDEAVSGKEDAPVTEKSICKASVSLIISRRGWCEQSEAWPPVVVSGPEEMNGEQAEGEPAGKRLIELI